MPLETDLESNALESATFVRAYCAHTPRVPPYQNVNTRAFKSVEKLNVIILIKESQFFRTLTGDHSRSLLKQMGFYGWKRRVPHFSSVYGDYAQAGLL